MMSSAARTPSTTAPASTGPAARGEASATVLVADGDGVSRRFVELTLGHHGLHVESVADGAGALEVLATIPVELILADIELRDMNGLQLHRRLTQESRLRGIPFVVWSADGRVETKTLALAAGVDDYLTKPCEGAELAARVRAHIARQRRVHQMLRQRACTLAGALSTIPFPDLVSIIELGRRSGRLSVVTDDRIGSAFFRQGEVVHALHGALSGPTAFHRMMVEEEGQFEFSPGPCEIDEAHRTIFEPVASLILEGARILDTARASGTMPAFSEAGEFTDESRIPTRPDLHVLTRIATPTPTPAVAAQLEAGIAGGYAVGDLRLFTHDQLIGWTTADLGRDRFHVHLIADLAAGVSSLLSLAGAPTERWVLDSLKPEAKVAGLAFFLRHERVIDLLLVDIDDPGAVKASLERVPSLTILAPRGGDLLTLGVANRVQLEEFFAHFLPPALLGVGNRSLEPGLQALVKDRPAAVRLVPGALCEADCDLRALLIDGLRLCSGTAGARERG